MKKQKKLLLAVGGTGGHLFPAQALAKKLEDVQFLFAGPGLSKNRYFQKQLFPFKDIQSGTFLTSNLVRNLKGCVSLIRGFFESLALFNEFKPDLVVGFGSYHSVPLLAAARLKKIPLILFASDTIPGKVIRFFSRYSLVSAVQFEEAKKYLAGATASVEMPFWSQTNCIPSQKEARDYYQLDPNKLTILIFGGSQGAQTVNQIAAELSLKTPFQVLHFIGHEKNLAEIQDIYKKRNINACVKPFEENMHYAWKAADVAICRAGAATLAEMAFYEVPALLIPYPYAADNHQKKNAEVFQTLGVASMLLEEELTIAKLSSMLEELPLSKMKEALRVLKQQEKKQELLTLILTHLKI